MKILVINGPNLNLLGKRDHALYGTEALSDIQKKIEKKARELGAAVAFFQSNHEGKLIDFLQTESELADGVIINPGALTHYSFSLCDALLDTRLPVVEVHLSDITKREPWRAKSVIKPAAVKQIMGKKGEGYLEALEFLVHYLKTH